MCMKVIRKIIKKDLIEIIDQGYMLSMHEIRERIRKKRGFIDYGTIYDCLQRINSMRILKRKKCFGMTFYGLDKAHRLCSNDIRRLEKKYENMS